MTGKQWYSNKKSEWKRSCAVAIRAANQLCKVAGTGAYVSQADIYKLGHKIYKLGDRGSEIAEEAVTLGMQARVIEDVQFLTAELETYSKKLYDLLCHRGYITKNFPAFESSLGLTSPPEDPSQDPYDELDMIMKGE